MAEGLKGIEGMVGEEVKLQPCRVLIIKSVTMTNTRLNRVQVTAFGASLAWAPLTIAHRLAGIRDS